MRTIPNLPATTFLNLSDTIENRPVLLITSSPAWMAVCEQLGGLNIIVRIDVTEATLAHWDSLCQRDGLRQAEIVYAVGGGLVADAAKYISGKLELPLVVIPTALSVDAFLTAASGIRRAGCVYYIETKVPDRLYLDLKTIAHAPPAIRAAGITDVMSIATGSWDWKFAHEQEKNPPGMEFIPWVHDAAQVILTAVMDCAEAAGRGDPEGLKTLFDCLAMEVQLCNQVGHARPEEGSEHYFAYAVENHIGHGFPHGDLVGPGIMLMARLQGQETRSFEAALQLCNIPLDRIPPVIKNKTLRELPGYCEIHQLPYGLAHTL